MPDLPAQRLDHLMSLREESLQDMLEAETEAARLRIRIERLESDQRLGAPVSDEYQDLKGHQLPRAETRLVEAYRSLLKIEQKILDSRRAG